MNRKNAARGARVFRSRIFFKPGMLVLALFMMVSCRNPLSGSGTSSTIDDSFAPGLNGGRGGTAISGTFSISGVTQPSAGDSAEDADLYYGVNPTVIWSMATGASSYNVSIVADDGVSTACGQQSTASASYSFSLCNLSRSTYYRAIVTAVDGNGNSLAATNSSYRFYVQPALTISNISTASVKAGATLAVAFTISGLRAASCSSSSFSFTTSNTAALTTGEGTWSGTAPNCTLNLSPSSARFGSTTIQITASDGATSTQRSFTAAVNGLVTLSTANNRVYPIDGTDEPFVQGTAGTVSFTGTDPESDTLTYSCTVGTYGLNSLDSAYVATGTNCSTLTGLTFTTSTGQISWTPTTSQRGTYKFSVTADDQRAGVNSTATSHVFISVRKAYSSSNLLCAFEALNSLDQTGLTGIASSPRSGSDNSTWLGLKGSFNGNLASSSFTGSWGGTGAAGSSHYLNFQGVSADRVDFGNVMNGQSQGRVDAWIYPRAASTLGAAVWTTGGGNGNGFTLRQSATSAGKLELRTGRDYKNTVLADNPVAYYRLNESTGTSAANSGSATLSATYIAGYTLGATGAHNSSGDDSDSGVTLNGSTGEVRISDDSSLDNISSTEGFAVEAWVYPTTVDANARGIVSKRSGSNSNDSFNLFLFTGGKIFFRVGGTGNQLIGTTVLSANNWYHVVGVFDPTLAAGSRLKIYVNGSLDATGTGPTSMSDNSSNVFIGLLNNGYGFSFAGNVDEVAIYRSALSAAQILAHYNAGTKKCLSTTTLSNDTWYFVSTAFDGTNSVMYINGAQECSAAFGSAASFTPTTNLFFGGRSTGTNPWTGRLGEMRAYSTPGDATAVTTEKNTTNSY